MLSSVSQMSLTYICILYTSDYNNCNNVSFNFINISKYFYTDININCQHSMKYHIMKVVSINCQKYLIV